MHPPRSRHEYELEYGTYSQPRHFLRKLLGRVLPRLPGFRLRRSLYRLLGCRLDDGVNFIGLDAYIDDVFPELVSIGAGSVISFRAVILAHDDAKHTVAKVSIGKGAFLGACAIIMPGVEIGDNAVVGAGAVVTRDVPAGGRVAGAPAKPIGGSGKPPGP